MNLKEPSDLKKNPNHVAIIMDGNGRWAQQQGHERLYGHQNGIRPIKAIMETCQEIYIPYLTLYAFSTENWRRPQDEVSGLWDLLVQAINDETETLQKNNIRLNVIGNTDVLDAFTKQTLLASLELTKNNNGFVLTLALNYGGRDEIITAAQKLTRQAVEGIIHPEEITETVFENALMTNDLPDLDLLIRTGGELRISNFLLWQAAYAELYFTPILWPDFNKEHFLEAIADFRTRERRLGAVSSQLINI